MARCFSRDEMLKTVQCLEMLCTTSSDEDEEEWMEYALKEIAECEKNIATENHEQGNLKKRKAETRLDEESPEDESTTAKQQKLAELEKRVKELRKKSFKDRHRRRREKMDLFRELVSGFSKLNEEDE